MESCAALASLWVEYYSTFTIRRNANKNALVSQPEAQNFPIDASDPTSSRRTQKLKPWQLAVGAHEDAHTD